MSVNWFVIQTYSGSEKSVLAIIKQRAERAGIVHFIEEILVPSKKVIQVKKGKKLEVEKNFFPGYVLAKMDLTNELWHLILNIPKVSNFISQSGRPLPIKEEEVQLILSQLSDDSVGIASDVEYEIGESVKIADSGPFDSFVGVIESLDLSRKHLVVSVSIFGRSTPVNLAFDQVEKI